MAFMPKKTRTGSAFGARLTELRSERGITQVQLAEKIGSTQRAISHWENHSEYPPGPIIVKLAKALQVTSDELLGLQIERAVTKPKEDPGSKRLWKKFQQVMALPEKDRRAVIRLINSLVSVQGESRSPRRKAS